MGADTVRTLMERRFNRGRSQWPLTWPGIAGCTAWVIEGVVSLLLREYHFNAPTPCVLLIPSLAFLSLGCVMAAVSERRAIRNPALLANGCFLLATATVVIWRVIAG